MKIGRYKYLLFFLLALAPSSAFSQINTDGISRILKNRKATVGIAFLKGDCLYTHNAAIHFPMASVFKFHVSLAALHKIETDRLLLDNMIWINTADMDADTYSPLLERYPDQRIRISYRRLLEYTLSLSDNNTCDLLIRFVGGIEKVNAYIQSLGIQGISLTQDEHSLNQELSNNYRNWSTPEAMVRLMEQLCTNRLLTPDHFTFIMKTMISSPIGAEKLKAGIPGNHLLAHKTGRSGRSEDGLLPADNDVGIVYLPTKEKCYIAIFLKDSRETDDTNAHIISELARIFFPSVHPVKIVE